MTKSVDFRPIFEEKRAHHTFWMKIFYDIFV